MSCERAAQVHAYHDGRLTAKPREQIEAHLQTCVRCAQLLMDLRALSQLLAHAPRAMIPPDALDRLRDSISVARERSILRISGWLTSAAAAVLVGALLLHPREHADGGSGNPVVAIAGWQIQAVMPPIAAPETSGADLAPAQWMADEFQVVDGPR